MTMLALNESRFEAPQARGAHEFAPGLPVSSVTAPFARNEEIYAEEDAARYVYKVVSGAVRITRLLGDGRRHISAFFLPGEVFGFEPGAAHRFAAEAVVNSRIAMARRSLIEDAASRNARIGRVMWDLTAHDLERLQEHMLLLGRKSALERVTTFLLEIADRLGGGDAIELPMSRSDIADYLGLTIETVSRTFTQLERDGLISMPIARLVTIRDRQAFETIAA
ncbi:MAG: helix-turn-helix domain-containing protein [Hyphomonadaceae bacterium]